MDAARPSYPLKLLSLQETARRLRVSVDTLLSWNEHHILTPKITKDGTVGYLEDQIAYFESIQDSLRQPSLSVSPSVTQDSFVEEKAIRTPIFKTQLTDVKTAKEFNFSQLFIIFGIGAPIAFILFFIKGSQVSQFWNQLLTFQSTVSSVNKTLESQTSRLAFPGTNPLTAPVSFGQQNTNENLQNTDKNSSFGFLWKSKVEKSKPSTSSGQVLAAKVVNLEKSLNTTGSSSGKLSAVAASVKSNAASTFSPYSNSDSGSFHIELGTLNTTNTIRNDTLTTTAAVGILGIMLFVLQSQLAVFGRKPQKNHTQPSVQKDHTQALIELEQKMDGSVVAVHQGKEYKICKPELYSDSDQFIERLMELTASDEKEIEYDSFTDARLRLATPLSRIVTRLNFVGLKRDLFFPRTSKNRVLFRRYITYQDLMTMNLTVTNVLSDLTKVG